MRKRKLPGYKVQGFIVTQTLRIIVVFVFSELPAWRFRSTMLILLPKKFLRFDWLRAEVFQFNLKHLHVKITVTIDCFHDPIMQYVLGGSLHKNNTIYLPLGLYHASVN